MFVFLPTKKNLFWFLKEGTQINLEDPAVLDMYVQQVLSHGGENDVRDLLHHLDPKTFKQSFLRIALFLQPEVRFFWEDFHGRHD